MIDVIPRLCGSVIRRMGIPLTETLRSVVKMLIFKLDDIYQLDTDFQVVEEKLSICNYHTYDIHEL